MQHLDDNDMVVWLHLQLRISATVSARPACGVVVDISEAAKPADVVTKQPQLDREWLQALYEADAAHKMDAPGPTSPSCGLHLPAASRLSKTIHRV